MGEGKPKRVRYRRRGRKPTLVGRILTAILAFPAAYMAAALIGSFVPVNRGWTEPDEGIAIYLADNGIHTDIVMPAAAEGLDWAKLVPSGIRARRLMVRSGSPSARARRRSISKPRPGGTSARGRSGQR